MSDAAAPFGAPSFCCAAGTVIGRRDGDLLRATGIRYGRAGRFERPVAEPAAAEPILATAPSPACPQPPDSVGSIVLGKVIESLPVDEHCQHLSITRPAAFTPDERLPVMVWIHGGSYTHGAGDAPIYDPANLVREHRVVVVNLSYRLGLLGFLGDPKGRPANLGLFDLIEALRWIRANIAAFGGDPDSVTLFGESAGADAVAHLMIADGARGLFRRVIIQSAPLGIVRKRAEMSAAMAKQANALDVASAPIADVLQAQLTVAAKALPFGLRGSMPFGVQYGMAPLPDERDLDAAWEAAARDIDVLIGSNHREVAFFLPHDPPLARAAAMPLIGPLLRALIIAVGGWQVYGAGIGPFARRHRRGGGRIFRYRLNWGSANMPYAGAHTIDLPLLLGSPSAWQGAALLEGALPSDLEAQGRQLRRIWADFARTGAATVTTIRGLIRVRRG